MQNSMRNATQAYATTASRRGPRAQEADVFRYANAMLRRAQGDTLQARALADNRRLWGTVIDLMRDPTNALPVTLRASIVSVGLSVQREMDKPNPDLEFLISINEDIASGLAA
jgi:flagellar biosynthesis regulator FlaF